MRELDPLLHSQLRLAIVSLLLSVETADFVYLKEKTNATAGNLSVQLEKLETAGYIQVKKEFVGKKTRRKLQGKVVSLHKKSCTRQIESKLSLRSFAFSLSQNPYAFC